MQRLATYLLLFFLGISSVQAEETGDSIAKPHKRPKIGLVLSGGGAKGFAHIGVIKVLEEAGLQIDYVAGTSMGAVIGALYASGYSTEQMEEIVRTQDWEKMMNDDIPRRYIPFEEKLTSTPYLATLPFFNKGIKVKTGLKGGQMVGLYLTRLTNHVSNIKDYDSIGIPFVCVATDIETGLPYRMRRGDIQRSIRASVSIPFYFTPIEVDGRLLVDGGLTDNFPVDVARELGADIIIGVDVQDELLSKDDIVSSPALASQIISLMGIEEYERAKANTDIYIHPDMRGAGMMDFQRGLEIIKCGEDKAREMLPLLRHLADSLQNIEAFVPKRTTAKQTDTILVTSIFFPDLDARNIKRLGKNFKKKPPHRMSINDIEEVIYKISTSGFYQDVWYDIDPEADGEGHSLTIHCKRVSDNAISIGAHYDTDYGIGILASVKMRNFIWKNYNHMLRFNAYIAESPYAELDFQFAQMRKFKFGLNIRAQQVGFDKYDGKNIEHNYKIQDNAAELYGAFSPSFFHLIKLSLKEQYTDFRDQKNKDESRYEFFSTIDLKYLYDHQDNAAFATKGIKFDILGRIIFPNEKKDDGNFYEPSLLLQGNFESAIKLMKRHSLKLGLFAGAKIGHEDVPMQYRFLVGGQSTMRYHDNIIPFTGLRFVQEDVDHVLFGKIAWQCNFYKNFYAIGKCDGGFMASSNETWFHRDQFTIGYGLTLGMTSFLGPIEVSVMHSTDSDSVFGFVTVGYTF